MGGSGSGWVLTGVCNYLLGWPPTVGCQAQAVTFVQVSLAARRQCHVFRQDACGNVGIQAGDQEPTKTYLANMADNTPRAQSHGGKGAWETIRTALGRLQERGAGAARAEAAFAPDVGPGPLFLSVAEAGRAFPRNLGDVWACARQALEASWLRSGCGHTRWHCRWPSFAFCFFVCFFFVVNQNPKSSF